MGAPLPPIDRDTRRLLVPTEGVVQRLARYHQCAVDNPAYHTVQPIPLLQ